MKEEGYFDIDEKDESRTEKFKTQEKATSEVSLIDIRQNRDGETSLYERYRKGSKSSS